MNKKYRVTLTNDERTLLQDLIASGTAPARTLTHARILLKADQSDGGPAWPDAAISEALEVSHATIARVRERFVAESLEAALHRRAASGHRRRCLDGAQEAHLIALTAVRHPPAMTAGPCASWPTSWWNLSTSTAFRMRPCAKS